MVKIWLAVAVTLTGAATAAMPNEQWDWSGGPGVTGPVWWFDDTFDSCEGIDWSDTPGYLYLSSGVSSGSLLSSILEIPMGTDWEIDWGEIYWESYEPAGTDVCFQLRTGYDWESMLEWGDTIYVSGTPLGPLLPDDVFYLQYRAILIRYDTLATPAPVLEMVAIEGDYPGSIASESSSLSTAQPLVISPNPSFNGEMTVDAYVDVTGLTELRVYDSAGRLIAVPISGILSMGPVSAEVSGLRTGVYQLLLNTEAGSASARVVVLGPP